MASEAFKKMLEMMGISNKQIERFNEADKKSQELAFKIMNLLGDEAEDPASTMLALATVVGSTLSFVDRARPGSQDMTRRLFMHLVEQEVKRFNSRVPI